jgi:hypothetical protein
MIERKNIGPVIACGIMLLGMVIAFSYGIMVGTISGMNYARCIAFQKKGETCGAELYWIVRW